MKSTISVVVVSSGVLVAACFVAACSSGSGIAIGGGAGSDPLTASGDHASSSSDPSGSSSEGAGAGAGGKCIACAGSFTCTQAGSDKTSVVTLTPAKGGLCDAEGLAFDPCTGQGAIEGKPGSWAVTAVGSGLHLCFTANGKTKCVDCVPGGKPTPPPGDVPPVSPPDAG